MSSESSERPLLLAIIEMGGYPNFTPLYQHLGYEVVIHSSMRKALSLLKKRKPAMIVAEFNFQSDFRDRTSSLESLCAVMQRLPGTRLIVFYEKEFRHQLDRLLARFSIDVVMPYPIEEQALQQQLERLREPAG